MRKAGSTSATRAACRRAQAPDGEVVIVPKKGQAPSTAVTRTSRTPAWAGTYPMAAKVVTVARAAQGPAPAHASESARRRRESPGAMREASARSAPSSERASPETAVRRLAVKVLMATSAAVPVAIAATSRRSRRRDARASRHASPSR